MLIFFSKTLCAFEMHIMKKNPGVYHYASGFFSYLLRRPHTTSGGFQFFLVTHIPTIDAANSTIVITIPGILIVSDDT